MVRSVCLASMAFCLALSGPTPLLGTEPIERLLPASTKAVASIHDVQQMRDLWSQTGLGQLFRDPALQPFLGDLKEKLKAKMIENGVQLGVSLDDLKGIVQGPAALAAIQPEFVKQQAAIVLLARIAGQEPQAQALLNRAIHKLEEQGSKRQASKVGAAQLWQIDFAIHGVSMRACYSMHDGWLIASDHRGAINDILQRLQAHDGKSLAELPAYQAVMERCRRNEAATVEWFIDPFGYVDVARAIIRRNGGCVRGDMAETLANQGFDAVEGVGGTIWLGDGQREVTHRTFVYAPGRGGPPSERFRLAARMLDLPNGEQLETPLSWAPANATLFAAVNFNAKEAFTYAKSLIDAIAKDEVFDDVLDSIKNDPNGPQVDLRNDLVAHLDHRISIFSDVTFPLDPASERGMFAIRLTNPEEVARAVDRAMGADPSVKKVQIGEHTVWEILNDPVDSELVAIEIEGEGFGFGDEDVKNNGDSSPTMPNFAVTVARGHLLVATQGTLLTDVLHRPENLNPALQDAADYQRTVAHLNELEPGYKSLHCFIRLAETLHPSYELIREGRMPESKSLVGQLLNTIGENSDGTPRKQKIDGRQLPDFAEVAKYLGPVGVTLQTQVDGWLLSGCFLSHP